MNETDAKKYEERATQPKLADDAGQTRNIQQEWPVKDTSPRIKWSFMNGKSSREIIKGAPVLKVRLDFLPAAVVSTANRLEQTDRTTSHSPDQMTSLWRVTTVSTLLQTSAMSNPDKTIAIAERARARLASASIFPAGLIPNIIRGRLKNAVTIDSDQIRIFRSWKDKLGKYDAHWFLIEIDATSMAKLSTHCKDIHQHSTAFDSISRNDTMEMVSLMMEDIRTLCCRSPILFQMSARELIIHCKYIRYGANDGHQFIIMGTSVEFREMIILFIALSDALGFKGKLAESMFQALVLFLLFLTNDDLKTVQVAIESRYRFKADRASLELLFLMVYDEIISQRV
jgi:hypothetical protein